MLTETGKILLDLTKPLTNGAINVEGFLQVQAKKRLDELLEDFSKQSAVRKSKSIFDIPRYNNTIFVSGQRGAGKTTFLKTYLSELNKTSINGGKILPIALIDPTLVHTNQPILVEIITCLKRAFENKLNGCHDSEKFHGFRDKLGKLSEGLKLLKIKKEDVDQDASWFLNKAIKNADSGHSLEDNLNELIDFVLKGLGAELLVIAIDDVDNDTTKAHDVLETIRKYITHPNIVVVVSGDLKIYSHIVKMKKSVELNSKAFDENENNELIEHLEQQYLVKIFPAEQRIFLKTLQGVIAEEDQNVYLVTGFSDKEIDVSDALGLLLSRFFKIDKIFINAFKNFILEQPIRTILQLFKNIDFEKPTFDDIKSLAVFINSSYVGLLKKENINTNKLLSEILHHNDIGLADFNLNYKYGELETGYYSRSDGEQDPYNLAQFFLASIKSKFLCQPNNTIGLAIRLMISTGAVSNIYLNYVEEKLKEKASIKDYIDFIGINRYTPTTSLVPHFSAFVIDTKATKKPIVAGGVARLPRSSKPDSSFISSFSRKFKKEGLDDNFRIKTLNNLINKQDEASTSIVDFISSKTITMSSHSNLTKNEGRDYLSSYLLISVIGELLCAKNDEMNLNSLISKYGSIQTFSSPSFVNIEGQGNEGSLDSGDDFSSDDDMREDDKNTKILEAILKVWINLDGNKSESLSFLLIGKVWSRIHYVLNSISEYASTKRIVTSEMPSRYIFLGELMTLWVTGIINSVLIEEVRHKEVYDASLISTLNKAKNVASASNVFLQNLKSVFSYYGFSGEVIRVDLPFLYSLLMCPLLWPYFLAELHGETKRALLNMINDAYSENVLIKIDSFSLEDMLEEFSTVNHSGLQFVSRLPVVGWGK